MKENLVGLFNYSVNNQAGVIDIFIVGDIVDSPTQELMKNLWGDETSVSFKSFRNQVTDANPRVINLTVTSDGGHVGDAMAIYDFLQDLKAKGVVVNTKATGIVASAGTYPAMAGGPENSEITDNGWAMIHEVSGAFRGNVTEFKNYTNTLIKFNDRVVDFYVNHTGQKREDIIQWMKDEEFMNAQTARARGFFKNTPTPAQNYTRPIKPENWQYRNTSVLAAYNKAFSTPTNNDKTMFEKFDELFKAACNACGIKISDKGVTEGLTLENLNKAMNTALTGLEPTLTAAINKAVDDKVAAIAETFKNILKDEEFTKSMGEQIAKNEAVTKLTGEMKTANENITKIQNDLIAGVKPAGGSGGGGTSGGAAGGSKVEDLFKHEDIVWDMQSES